MLDRLPVHDLASLAQVAADLPIYLVLVENGRIADIRITTRDFIVTHLAAQMLAQQGKQETGKQGKEGITCEETAGRFRLCSD